MGRKLRECTLCDGKVSGQALSCSHCGQPFRYAFLGLSPPFIFAAAAFLLAFEGGYRPWPAAGIAVVVYVVSVLLETIVESIVLGGPFMRDAADSSENEN